MTVNYDGMVWDVSELPNSSCTPDDEYEWSYTATTICPNCGGRIDGEANFRSDLPDMDTASLYNIDYDECDCHDEDYEEDDDDFDDEF